MKIKVQSRFFSLRERLWGPRPPLREGVHHGWGGGADRCGRGRPRSGWRVGVGASNAHGRRASAWRPVEDDPAGQCVFIGLDAPEAERRGEVWVFDVADKPPRRGRPRRVDPPSGQARTGLLTLDEMVGEIVKAYGIRNQRYIEWADEEEPVMPDLDAPLEDGGEEGEDE